MWNFSCQAWLSDQNIEPERLPLSNARRVVVKVGTAVVSNPDGTLALSRMGALVEQVRPKHSCSGVVTSPELYFDCHFGPALCAAP